MPKKERPHNGGTWTKARYRGFITSALRQGSQRWPPKHEALKLARVGRNEYKCASCGKVGPKTLPPEAGKKRRRNNAVVDHIEPIVPVTGFTTWDDFIRRLYCEVDGLQILCHKCNATKTKGENDERKKHRGT